MQKLKYDTNKFMKQKQTQRHREQTVVGVWGRDILGVWNQQVFLKRSQIINIGKDE